MYETPQGPELPPDPIGQGQKLDLILWRLRAIETQLDTKTVGRTEWQTHHEHLAGRVRMLEEDVENERADKRKITVGIILALVVPVSKWTLDLIQLTQH